jgi:16S rRNA (guanine966-N2)-methyltransferase
MAGQRLETPFHAEGVVRITGGVFRGRALFAPPDARVRPTSDKVRQAIFNVLAHNDFGMGFSLEGARALDLFAGTGAIGLEAVSRSARYCLFVDDSAESRALIRKNVEALQLTGATKIWRRDATQLGPMPPGSGGPFDLVFLDPPYWKNLIPPALAALLEGGWLADKALLVAETAEDEAPTAPGYSVLDAHVYGDTRVTFLCRT